MHQAEKLLLAHLTTKATIASVGVLYGLCIGADAATKAISWVRVHDAIREHFSPAGDDAWFAKLNRIKKAGWDMHSAVAKQLNK